MAYPSTAISFGNSRQHIGDIHGDVHNNYGASTLEENRRNAKRRVLNSLHFDTINQRQNMIESRVGDFGSSFGWIFDEKAGHDFAKWLRHGSGIFWINGIAASGKSSLMAFIWRRLRSKPEDLMSPKHFPSPTEPRAVRMLSVFFYNPSSDPMQKTFTGFWRSLCYQILFQDPNLFDVISHHAEPACFVSILEDDLAHANFLDLDLNKAFFFLIGHAIKTADYFILIDGLDEFADQQPLLIDVIEGIARVGDAVKVCCSSRPEIVFRQRLSTYPSLRVQDLTDRDIRDYCHSRLSNTAASKLIDDIVWKAQGVWLWVSIVVNDLQAAAAHDSPEELMNRLQNCPTKMAELFSHMRKRCDSFYTKNPKPYLRLVYTAITNQMDITLLDLLLADIPAETLMPQLRAGFEEAFLRKLRDKLGQLESQIIARTAGLVQFSALRHRLRSPTKTQTLVVIPFSTEIVEFENAGERRADFIHRTAKDFLEEEIDGQIMLNECHVSEYKQYMDLLRASTAWSYFVTNHNASDWSYARKFGYAVRIEDLSESYSDYFDLLDISFCWVSSALTDPGARNLILLANQDPSLECISPALSWPKNQIISILWEMDLFTYAKRKISQLPSNQKVEAAAVCLINWISRQRQYYLGGSKLRRDASPGLVDPLVALLTSNHAIQLIHSCRYHGSSTFTLETVASIRDHVLAAVISSVENSHKYTGKEPGLNSKLLGVDQWLKEPDLSERTEIPIQLMVVPKARYRNEIEYTALYCAGEVCSEVNACVSFRLSMSCTRGWIFSRYLESSGQEHVDAPLPRFINISPPGVERSFALTGQDSRCLLQALTSPSGLVGDNRTLVEVGGRVLNANWNLLSEKDFRMLKRSGWKIKEQNFDGFERCLDEYGESDSNSEGTDDDREVESDPANPS